MGLHINDISTTEMTIIDTWPSLFNIQKELIKCKGTDDKHGGYIFWSFLNEWGNFNMERKMEKYDEFASHEMNLFLYFKGNQLFYLLIFILIAINF